MNESQIKGMQESFAELHRHLAYFRNHRRFGHRIRKLETTVFTARVCGAAAVIGIAIVAGVTWFRVPNVAASTAEDKARMIATEVVNKKLPPGIALEIEGYRDRAKIAAEEAEQKRDEVVATLRRFRESVPLGMIIPFFGKTMPDGFVLADGKETWPDEDWVPDHLRPKNGVAVPVPDLRGQMLGGAMDVIEVGTVWAQGAIRVDGERFQLPESEQTEKPYPDMIQWIRGGPAGSKLPDLKTNGPGNKDGPPAQVNTITVTDTTFKYRGSIGGSQVISLDSRETLPSHLMCQFIIRIR